MKTDTFDPIHAAEIVEDAAMYLTDQHVLPCDESNACAESLSILGMRLRDMARQSASTGHWWCYSTMPPVPLN